jgi:hypothetical protein
MPADFFGRVFELEDEDPVELHRRSVDVLRRDAADWDHGPVDAPPDRS